MRVRTVYLETTIVSYLASRQSHHLLTAACQQATRDWWEEHRADYELFTSQLVVTEAGSGDPEIAKKRLSLLDGIQALEMNDEVSKLARRLVSEGALPAKAGADALHVAVAAVHHIDLLLTWNCRHIDNPVTKPALRSVCAAAGYTCPEICTPLEILEVESDDE